MYALNVTFVGKQPANKQVDIVVRGCLAAAIKVDVSKEILVETWFRTNERDESRYDRMFSVWGAGNYISYNPSKKAVVVQATTLAKWSGASLNLRIEFEFQARPVIAVEDAVRVELEAIAWRDGLKRN